MRPSMLFIAVTLFLYSCNDEPKNNESKSNDGFQMSVTDSDSKAEVNISAKGIEVKSNDSDEANVSITPAGIEVKSKNGEEANVQINKDGIDIKSKDGDGSVKVDKQGNMKIKSADGKEIEVKVKK